VRRQLVEDKTWYRSQQIDEYRRPAGLDDCIYSLVVGPRISRCVSIHRPWNDKPFTQHERALVHVVHAECAALLEKNDDVTILETLNRRLRQTLEGLVRGLTEKQLASELGLSQHTLHGYVKTLYRRLGVSSRGELHAPFDRLIG
jgi:DNA-binding CsgD family transcriptional regulator